jgi:hypothetical protein
MGVNKMAKFVTADELIVFNYKKMGNWYLHPSGKVSVNLISNTICCPKPYFVIERKDNNFDIGLINSLSDTLIKLGV